MKNWEKIGLVTLFAGSVAGCAPGYVFPPAKWYDSFMEKRNKLSDAGLKNLGYVGGHILALGAEEIEPGTIIVSCENDDNNIYVFKPIERPAGSGKYVYSRHPYGTVPYRLGQQEATCERVYQDNAQNGSTAVVQGGFNDFVVKYPELIFDRD